MKLEPGIKIGRLTLIEIAGRKRYPPRGVCVMWRCLCECGKEKVIATTSLKSGATRSCGCFLMEVLRSRIKHGYTRTHGKGNPLYGRWVAMLSRCNNPKNIGYKGYGGRGIKVLWNTFEEFYSDMFKTWAPGLTIDRIDVNGHYCKENCRWATRQEQALNRRDNIWAELNGDKRKIHDWSKIYGIPREDIWRRLKLGWPQAAAITLPIQYGPLRNRI